MSREPVKYTVLERSLVGNTIYEEGATVEYAGLPAENLAPQCEVGAARYQEYLDSNKARVAKMIEQNAESSHGDPAAFAAAVRAAVAQSNAEHAESQAKLLQALTDMQAGQPALIAQAVAAAIAQVFPNGTAKKAVEPTGPATETAIA